MFGNIFSGPARGPEHQQRNEIVTGALATAVQRLEEAVQRGNTEAIYLLAELNFYGYYGHPRNLHDAFRYYQTLASEHGNSTAQHMLGVYHSTGLGDVVPQNQAKALLYYNFAAITGNPRSEMALGYRYDAGIGAIKSCETAAKHYKSVADKVMDWYRSGPPGGRNWVQEAWHISEEDGGVYGEGASASSSGSNAALKASGTMESDAKIADIIEYLDLMSQKGDSKATASLGRMYYNGQRGLPTNYELARKYFRTVSLRYWKSDLQSKDVKQPIDRVAASVAGYIGKMHLRGEGVPQNFEKAKLWFERGQTYGDPMSQHLRGLMELHGYGVDRNIKMAVALFRSAADQNYGPARVQLGRLLLEQGDEQDLRLARTHFEQAVAMYSDIEALYFLGEMSLHGIGKDKTCAQAVRYYKFVVERAEPFLSSWCEASRAYEDGANDLAYLHFLLAAEQGYEYAQSNVAYMLDTERDSKSMFSLFQEYRPSSKLLSNPREALIYWTRSSRQSNVDATVKMGDYYFHGIGAKADVKKAVQCYTGASEHSQSAQAMYNLGWMHENGIGLDQDFHLAKRYYDMALEVNKEAYLPVTLSLLKLRLRSAWNTVTNGPIHSIRDDPSKFAFVVQYIHHTNKLDRAQKGLVFIRVVQQLLERRSHICRRRAV